MFQVVGPHGGSRTPRASQPIASSGSDEPPSRHIIAPDVQSSTTLQSIHAAPDRLAVVSSKQRYVHRLAVARALLTTPSTAQIAFRADHMSELIDRHTFSGTIASVKHPQRLCRSGQTNS